MNEQTWMWFDRSYTILEVEGEHANAIRHTVGKNLWVEYPDAKGTFWKLYENAWEVGHSYAVVQWRGALTSVNANRCGDALVVSIRSLPIEGLEKALRDLLDVLAPRAQREPEAPPRPGLRLVRDQG